MNKSLVTRSAHTIILIVTLLCFQLLILFGGIWFSISMHNDCSFTGGPFSVWECSETSDPTLLPIIAFFIVPPFVARWSLKNFGYTFSWRRVFLTHAFIALLTWLTILKIDATTYGCGGA